MNQSEHFTDSNIIEAKIALDLPGTASASELPNEIQWAPPGRHNINASRGGKAVNLDVNVTEAGAHRVIAHHAAYMAAAAKGAGDLPYFDFNHDDKEASAHPKSFSWGGNDPQKGGIRAQVDWTGAGKRAVTGREFRRFSPSFYVGDDGEISGAPVNMGGLVNRAAFQKIAPVMSRQAEVDALTSAPDFLAKAKVMARAENLSIADACVVLARRDPSEYERYRYNVLGLGQAPIRREDSSYLARYRQAEGDEFVIRANALADALDISLHKASQQLARSQPALYERYRGKLGLGNDREYENTVSAVHARAEQSEFFTLSKRIAAEQSIELVKAFIIAARQRPDLYDSYHASL